jgi:hypothetical protein
MQPVIATFVNANIAKHRSNQLAGAQAGRITEIEKETQPLCRRFGPAVSALDAVGDGARQQSITFAKAASSVQCGVGALKS